MTSPASSPPSGSLIEPVLRDEALLRDIEEAPRTPDRFSLWWLGQSGFLLQWQESRLIFDPYLSDSLTEKYAETDKPHVRMTARAVAPDRLSGIDVVTSSHAHTDHLDGETLRALAAANPGMVLVASSAHLALARERLAPEQASLVGLNRGESTCLGPFRITAVAAAHNAIETDPEGRHLYLGYVVSFGPFSVYHSGDTLRHEDLVAEVRPLTPALCLLPINGNRPERRVAGNLDGPEAAALAHDLGAQLVIPCHYDMFTFNTASPDDFVAACRRLKQAFRVLRCGERLEVTADPVR